MSGWWPPCGFSTLSPPRSLRTRGLIEQSLPPRACRIGTLGGALDGISFQLAVGLTKKTSDSERIVGDSSKGFPKELLPPRIQLFGEQNELLPPMINYRFFCDQNEILPPRMDRIAGDQNELELVVRSK